MKNWEWDSIGMTDTTGKHFSSSLFSLQMQLKTLMEDSGGDRVIELLDTLCQLSSEEQGLILDSYINVTKKISAGGVHLKSQFDVEKKNFEDELYSSLVTAFKKQQSECIRSKFELLPGGRSDKKKTNVVSFKKFTQDKILQ